MFSNILKYALALLVGFGVGVWYWNTRPIETQVVERIDTITIKVVEEKVVYRDVVRKDTVYVAVANTTDTPDTKEDSVNVVIPIERKVYADSLYRAVVSGYKPSLDSMTVYPRTTIVKTTIEQPRSPFAFSVGVQMGYGITPRGCQPYAGLGVSFGYTFGNKIKNKKRNERIY